MQAEAVSGGATRQRHSDDQHWPNAFWDETVSYRVEPIERLASYKKLKEQGRHEEAREFLRQFVAETPDEVSCFALGTDQSGLDLRDYT